MHCVAMVNLHWKIMNKKYGILDDENKVVRWLDFKPSLNYKFIIVKIPKDIKPKIDWNNFDIAPF